MAAELKEVLDLDATLEVGSPGEFTIWVDGAKVSEKSQGRFPEVSDVVAAVRAALP